MHRNVAVTKVIRKQQHNIRRTFVTGCDVGNAGKQFSFCSLAVRISRKDGDVGYFFGGRRVFASSTPFCVRLCFFLSDKAISIGVHSFEQGRVLDFIGSKPSITVLVCPGECGLIATCFVWVGLVFGFVLGTTLTQTRAKQNVMKNGNSS